MIDAGDERDGLDRRGDVAQRVELRSAGASRAVWPTRQAPTSRTSARNARPGGPPGSPGSPRACRACRRCGRDRARRSSGTFTPQAAASGASGERDLVADAARGVLVDLRAGDVREVEHVARARASRSVSAAHLGVVHPAEEHRHAEGGHLVVGDFAAREPTDERGDLLGRDRPAVTLAMDDLVGGVGRPPTPALPEDRVDQLVHHVGELVDAVRLGEEPVRAGLLGDLRPARRRAWS